MKITSTQLSKSPKIPKSPTEIAAPFAPSMKPSASLNSPIQAKPSDFLNNIEKELSLSPQPIRKGEATTTNRTQLPLSKKETIPKKVTINHDNPKELGRPDVKNPESPTNIARDYFTIGSSKDEVIAVQGTPTEFSDLVWHYGYSKVYFQDGHVKSWDILYSNPLKVKMIPQKTNKNPNDYSTVGSSKDEVIAVQGTPTEFNDLVWHYGYSKVYFQDGHVKSWDILYSNPLKVKMIPQKTNKNPNDYFTVGSSKDEVLAVQGTPTELNESIWNYGYSKVYFQDGYVKSWDILSTNPLKVKMTQSKSLERK